MVLHHRQQPGRPATPVGYEIVGPTTDQERAHFVRYTRPERWPIFTRFPVSGPVQEEILAQMVSWDAEQVRECLQVMATTVAGLAEGMLAEPGFQVAMEALPFRAGDRVAAVGDSLTADRLGWFEMITAMMPLAGHTDVVTENFGVSGSTTADAMERFDILEAFQPTHVLVMLGTNDVRRHGRRRTHRMASSTETRRNFSALLDLMVQDLDADVALLTPPPAEQARISATFGNDPVRWSATELDAVSDVVRDIMPHCIDVHAALQTQHLAELLESDGVHLNVPGQQVVARIVLQALATGRPWLVRPATPLFAG